MGRGQACKFTDRDTLLGNQVQHSSSVAFWALPNFIDSAKSCSEKKTLLEKYELYNESKSTKLIMEKLSKPMLSSIQMPGLWVADDFNTTSCVLLLPQN